MISVGTFWHVRPYNFVVFSRTFLRYVCRLYCNVGAPCSDGWIFAQHFCIILRLTIWFGCKENRAKIFITFSPRRLLYKGHEKSRFSTYISHSRLSRKRSKIWPLLQWKTVNLVCNLSNSAMSNGFEWPLKVMTFLKLIFTYLEWPVTQFQRHAAMLTSFKI